MGGIQPSNNVGTTHNCSDKKWNTCNEAPQKNDTNEVLFSSSFQLIAILAFFSDSWLLGR